MACAQILNVFGLVANLLGVILLFLFGMPFRIRTGGETFYVRSGVPDQRVIRTEERYERWGMLGLILIVLGTAAQMAAIFL